MSQAASWGVSTSGPQTPGAHAVENNDSLNALLSGHIGVARPSYAVQGTFWNKDTSSSPLIIERYFFDGTDDILTGSFNIATNTFTPVTTGLASLTEAQTFTKTQTWTKGADVASATNLALGDGNYFDITGTATITGIATKGVGTTVKLHFDDVLTLTHSAADLVLPGGANITTAAGDEAEFVEYATGDWRCTVYTKASGEAVVAAGGAWNLVGTIEASNDATLTITGLDSTYDQYVIGISDMVPTSDGVGLYLRVGDSGGIDSGASDYAWGFYGDNANDTSWDGQSQQDNADSAIHICSPAFMGSMGNQPGEGLGCLLSLNRPGDGTTYPGFSGTIVSVSDVGQSQVLFMGGHRLSAITLDRIQIFCSTGNISTGRLSVWGISHE